MEPVILNEYRCQCGKLLFKGVLLTCILEIKCKRCSKISTFNNYYPRQTPVSFSLAVDENGIITDACHGVEALLEYPWQELIGKPIVDICPILRDGESRSDIHNSLAADETYKIKKNIFLVRDGGTIAPESYLISQRKNGVFAGYRMFNLLPNAGKDGRLVVY
jgi:phage FluMu protein Com